MKLTAKTKHDVKIGDVVQFSYGDAYVVTGIIDTGRCVSYALQDIKTKRTIYGMPSSECYGAEIIKQEV